MSILNLSSGTTALTNALKQVFYIHKDVVAELKEKLESLMKENDHLKQQQKEGPKNSNVSKHCEFCKSPDELHRSLQKKFDSQLTDKDVIIKRLEARIDELSRSLDTQTGDETSLSLNGEKTSSQSKILSKPSSPENSKDCVTPLSTSPSKSDMISGKKTNSNSRLKLPKEGQKRRRYVEQENLPGFKRHKTSPNASPDRNTDSHSQSQNENADMSLKRKRILSRKNSREFQKALPCQSQSKNVLVPETENFTCLDGDEKCKESSTFSQKLMDRTNEKSPDFLTIPETIVVDEFSQEAGEDVHEDECEGLFNENKSPNLLASGETVLLSESSQKYSRESETPKSMAGLSVEDITMKSSHILNNGVDEENDLDENYKASEKNASSANLNDNVSMTSPMSPGIFDALARPLSHIHTPKTSKISQTDSQSEKKFISCTSKPTKETAEKFLRSKSDSSAFDTRGLLRQTTLSQSFCNKSVSILGTRKSKSLRDKSDYVKVKEEDDDDAILKEVLEKSLTESDKKPQEVSTVSSFSSHNSNNEALSSPFKVPSSPSRGMRRSPRSKVKNDHQNSKQSQNFVDSTKKTSENKQFASDENYYDSDNDLFVASPSSPARNVKIEAEDQGLRRSPRLLTTSPKGERRDGDIAKRALFLGGKGTTSQSLKKNVAQRIPPKSSLFTSSRSDPGVKKRSDSTLCSTQYSVVDDNDKDELRVRNTAVSQGLNSSLDPIMCLSMYLDSEATNVTSTSQRKVAMNKGTVVKNSPPPPAMSSSLSQTRLDMDETVAPNAITFPATVEGDESQRHSQTSHRDSQTKGTNRGRNKLTRKRGNSSQSRGLDKSYSNEAGESINLDDTADVINEDIEETIGPSPQPVRPSHSQSLRKMSTYTAHQHTFNKFLTAAGRSRSSDDDESKTMQAEDDEESLDFVIGDIGHDGNSSSNNINNVGGKADDNNGRVAFAKPSLQPPTHTTASLYDSFDVVPKKTPEFPHVQVVRKKLDRDKLQGFSCHQCAEYYKDMNLTERELQQRMRACSRHKEKYKPPSTPEHFWSLSIRDTAEDQAEVADKQPEAVRLRRRRRLEKKFKSKTEKDEEED